MIISWSETDENEPARYSSTRQLPYNYSQRNQRSIAGSAIMKIVVLDGRSLSADDNPWTPVLKLGPADIHDQTHEGELLPRSKGATILVTNKVRLSADT